jgi:hypothetical protein
MVPRLNVGHTREDHRWGTSDIFFANVWTAMIQFADKAAPSQISNTLNIVL